ncbi:MAG TPA: carboxymuconolactone decarboxylase family protein [Streptosporangiaceae bacterium]|jgi:alkylhydroperoxidase/carboxymuconolactone decarboxylase family protein YurZ|nr:carboxymuconolactone decarboxylase family protein [Streptosporangiaceae bacterium]
MTTTISAPSTSRLIDLNPALAESYQAFVSAVFEDGALDPAVAAAAALAASIAFNRQESVRSYLALAKQSGLSNEDIGRVAAIVDVVRVESHQRPASASTSHAEHAHQPKASKSCC